MAQTNERVALKQVERPGALSVSIPELPTGVSIKLHDPKDSSRGQIFSSAPETVESSLP